MIMSRGIDFLKAKKYEFGVYFKDFEQVFKSLKNTIFEVFFESNIDLKALVKCNLTLFILLSHLLMIIILEK